jgi:segregation and condensation protein B
MLTLPAYNTWLTKLLRARDETKLSQAAMETLAIVAYKQPVTRADVEAIRGVAAGDMLNRLREMNLVKIVGRAEDLGRPLLYGTTRNFLEVFGLGSLEDLPQVEVLRSGSSQTATPVAEPAAPPPESTDQPPALKIATEE